VVPQALRIIIPPLTSQYLNLTKNSSLAIAIGFADYFAVSGTILNQTGQAVELMLLVVIAYLLLSIVTSIFMNWFNAKMALVER
jgi:general L-amino acid transport system permease protein